MPADAPARSGTRSTSGPGAQLHAHRRAALDEARRAGRAVLPDDVADRHLVGVAAVLLVDLAARRRGPASSLRASLTRAADEIRRRQRAPLHEEREPEVRAAAEDEQQQRAEQEVDETAALHRRSARSLFSSCRSTWRSWSARYSASSYFRSCVFRPTNSGISARFQTSSTRSAKTNSSFSFGLLRHFLQVLAVPFRQHHGLDVRAMRGHHLLLDAADGEHLAAQRDLARHGHIVAHRTLPHHRGDAGGDGHAGGGAVFRDGAGREVDVDVVLAELLVVDLEVVRLASARTNTPPTPTRASRRRAGR